MIQIEDKKECCGCGSCAQCCPQKCISMNEDQEGFLYPVIDSKLCVKCGLCEKKCPIIQKKSQQNEHNIKTFVALHKNDSVRSESSSGGIFLALAG